VAVLVVLALGTSGATAIFSAMNALLLQPLPGTTEPERLFSLERTLPDGSSSLNASYLYYESVRDGSSTMDGIAAWSNVTLSITAGEEGNAAAGNIVSGNYFDVLGVRPALGRFFAAEESSAPLTHSVVVVSYNFWRTRLSADSAVVGNTVSVNGQPYTLIGVTPPSFQGVFTRLRTDAWVPLMMQAHLRPDRDLTDPEARWLRLFGRLGARIADAAAHAEMASLTAAYALGEPERFRTFTGIKMSAMTGMPVEAYQAALRFMTLLLGAASLVLMIASINVAGMLSVRALRRRREMALRLALGATRGRILRQLLTETLLLFVFGGVAGVTLAAAATGVLGSLPVPGGPPIPLKLSPDFRVLSFALFSSLAMGLLFGLAPALQTARKDLISRLRDGAPGSGVRRTMLSNALVVGQLTSSLVLLVTAGLFLRALDRGQRIDTGFDATGVATTPLNTLSWGYDEARSHEFYRALLDRIGAMPGVTAVSTAGYLPLQSGTSGGNIEVSGAEVPVQTLNVDKGYFDVLRLPLVGGRAFAASDDDGSERVAVINETLAQRHWPAGDAVGSTFAARGGPIKVVGVARDAKYASLTEATQAFVYYPMAQAWSPSQILIVRTDGDVSSLAPALTEVIRELDRMVPPPTVTTLEQATRTALMPQRVAASVSGGLGALGLLLAAVGLYGIMAFSVSQRSREIGLRMALGARRGDVLRMVLRRGLGLAGLGVLIGLPLAAVATRIMKGLLLGLNPLDALTFVGMSAVFLAVALIATYLPARGAAAADPAAVLRAE
jgi:predicted permease